jgi:hypothetical protein
LSSKSSRFDSISVIVKPGNPIAKGGSWDTRDYFG